MRSVHYEGEDIDKIGIDRKLDKVSMRVCGSRDSLEPWKSAEGYHLWLDPIESFVGMHRTIRAVHNVRKLPLRMKQYLFGAYIPSLHVDCTDEHCKQCAEGNGDYPKDDGQVVMGWNPARHRSATKRISLTSMPTNELNALYARIDTGCIECLTTCCDMLNVMQKASVLTSLREICNNQEVSFSLIHGPPGTGKTTTMAYLIGAMIHHSVYGDMNGAVIMERNGDKYLMASENKDAFSGFVCLRVLIRLLTQLRGG